MSTIRQDPFVRAAQVVGDFANPFYAEERQRDVWNEAQAFGLQLAVWVMLSAGAISVWWVGAAVVPYVLTALGLLGLVCVLTLAYAQRLGVDVASPQRLLRLRLMPFGVIVVVLAGGLVRAQQSGSADFVAGAAAGAVVAVLIVALSFRRRRADRS